MAGNSNLLSGRRKEKTFYSISSACVQGNYNSWQPQELKFNLHGRRSLLSTFPQTEKEKIKGSWFRVEPFSFDGKKIPHLMQFEPLNLGKKTKKQNKTCLIVQKIPNPLFCSINSYSTRANKISVKRQMEQISDGESEWESSLVGKKERRKNAGPGFFCTQHKMFQLQMKKRINLACFPRLPNS